MNNNMKASDEEILTAYKETKSVWRAAELLGMCGQSVWGRLTKLNAIRSNKYTDSQKEKIFELYASGIKRGDGKLGKLADEIGILKSNISRFARRHGLTKRDRSLTEDRKEQMLKNLSAAIEKNGHPRGSLGLKHSDETKALISRNVKTAVANRSEEDEDARILKMMKTRAKNGTLVPNNRHKASWKAAWRTIGGQRKYFRSRWEANYAWYLEFMKQQGKIAGWRHEPTTFWFEAIKRGVRSYLPDFEVTRNDGSIYFVEVKGWMDQRSKTKLKRMKKYHPDVELELVDSKRYRALSLIHI